MKEIVLGTATWPAHEGSVLWFHRLHRYGLELEALDEAALTIWLAEYSYRPVYEREAEHGGRWRRHDEGRNT